LRPRIGDRIQSVRKGVSTTTALTKEPATWVRPEFVCEVRFTAWTGGHLRHPIFVGMCASER
jgi:ATP-dependent DNA ligase